MALDFRVLAPPFLKKKNLALFLPFMVRYGVGSGHVHFGRVCAMDEMDLKHLITDGLRRWNNILFSQ